MNKKRFYPLYNNVTEHKLVILLLNKHKMNKVSQQKPQEQLNSAIGIPLVSEVKG